MECSMYYAIFQFTANLLLLFNNTEERGNAELYMILCANSVKTESVLTYHNIEDRYKANDVHDICLCQIIMKI